MALRALGGMPLRPGAFPFLEFGDGTFDLLEGDWGVDVGNAWLLGDKFKDGVVNWSMVVEDFVEVHAED